MIHITSAWRTILSDWNEIKIFNLCTFVISTITEFMVSDCLATDRINRQRALELSLHKTWSFPLRISSVNVTKSAVPAGFGHIYWRNP